MMRISAIIITYNPNIENVINLCKELLTQNVSVIVVDNASENIGNLRSELDKLNTVELLALNKNFGIAFAQNRGIDLASQKNANYLLFFDQDSSIPEKYITYLFSDFKQASEIFAKPIGIIGPRFTDKRYGFYYNAITLDKNGFRTKVDVSNLTEPISTSLVISSGSMIPVEVIEKVGVMDERFFIDYVDTEWCLRALSQNYEVIISSKAQMEHSIGDNILKIWKFNVPVHSPFRRYYRVRNAFFLLRMKHVPLLLSIREISFNSIQQMILVLFTKNHIGYLKSWYRGIKDGMLNKEKI